MVLGIRSKLRRGASVKVEYIVHVQEIKPWPPSESLRSVQKVLLQWENGNQYSGSFLSAAQNSKLVFTESFNLPLILYLDKRSHDKFQKNCLEFSLFVPRKDRAKGHLIGTAVLNLADYGVMDSMLSIEVPVNIRKSSYNSVPPSLVIGLEPVEKERSNSSPSVGLSKQTSFDTNSDDLEIASITDDDDDSSQSSRTAGSSTIHEVGTSSPSLVERNGYGNAGRESERKRNGRLPPTDTSSGTRKQENGNDAFSKLRERSMTSVKNSATPHLRTFTSSISHRDANVKPNSRVATFLHESTCPSSDEDIATSKHETIENMEQYVEVKSSKGFAPEAIAVPADNHGENAVEFNSAFSLHSHASQENELQEDNEQINGALDDMVSVKGKKELKSMGSDYHIMEEMTHFPEIRSFGNLSQDSIGQETVMSEISIPSSKRTPHMKNVHIHGSVEGDALPSNIYAGGEDPNLEIPYASQKKGSFGAVKHPKIETPDCRDESKTDSQKKGSFGAVIDPKTETPDRRDESKIEIEMLQEELREAAVSEVGLYSAVAEHASSANKVHTPARRLSRFYTDACKAGSQAKRASAARAAVSGLVVVSKSCGHDVPRLTFWLSNSIMLRAIVSQTAAEFSNYNVEGKQSTSTDESDDKEDVSAFITALEKVESWLFSRIVESLWWQTFTPHMQPTVAKASDMSPYSENKKTCGRRNSLGNHEQGNFSIQLWKKAFIDARERLCPLRAGGHECGCLSVLFRLVMEQLVDRLDTAMFNAILRESAEEMPTDPVSDPISESKVLPIPYGNLSFGAAVELKNSIGNWSRWLTDLFGLEDDSTDRESIRGDGKSFKAFRLLHSLSDLMMVPFEMLADPSTRKEVFPIFGPTIIKRVLNSFVPDEFCPGPIPQNIIDALETEEDSDASEDTLTSLPCTASPKKYTPPSAALLTCVGEVGNQVLQSSRLSSLKKSYNSDDELDELDSPFTSITPDSYQSSALAKLSSIARKKGGRNVVRYQLLREIWKDDE